MHLYVKKLYLFVYLIIPKKRWKHMSPQWSTILSCVFLAFGAIAVYTMMARWGRDISKPELYRISHIIAGWIFILLFLVIFIIMIIRVENYWEESSPRISIHVTLSVILLLMLMAKASIPRIFPKLSRHLFSLGFSVYLAAFTLVGITAGYYLLWRLEEMPYISHIQFPAHIVKEMLDERLGKELFITKCSTCHILENIMHPRSVDSWEKVINDMVVLAEPRINLEEASQILNYLSLTHTPRSPEASEQASPVERHCLPCHEPTEIYQHHLGHSGWIEIVRQMHEYDPKIVPEEKIEEIVDFLVREQESQR